MSESPKGVFAALLAEYTDYKKADGSNRDLDEVHAEDAAEWLARFDAAMSGEYRRGWNDGAEAARNANETAGNS